MALRIEDYALIGDCETVALAGKDGSIDWLCWPDFSSPACFAALVGDKENGRWRIAPRERVSKVTQKYREHTLILETRFETRSGVLLLTDFMPVRERHSDVVRIARCLHGRVTVEMELAVRFDYGRTIPWTDSRDGSTWSAAAGPGVVYLRTRESLRTESLAAYASFTLKQGQERSFALTYASAEESPPRPINVKEALAQTKQFWLKWCASNTYDGPQYDAVERSLITLKALTYRPSGGIVAAATTSIPERAGSGSNWDYRYCWLRDAAFTMESLLAAGYHDEARAWQQWLLQSVGGDARGMQIMYGMHGERHLPERELSWLRGYGGTKPVRIGNAACQQFQLDVFGEVADAIVKMRSKIPLDPRTDRLQEMLTRYVAEICHLPSSGIWEQRGRQDHFTSSKMMAWLALDHGIRTIGRDKNSAETRVWTRKRDWLHRQICRRGFNRRLGSFVQAFDSAKLDASVLLLPLFGFLPFDDPRIKSTVNAIEKHLTRNGLVYRYRPEKNGQREGTFLACSFWLVQNLAGIGRGKEAEKLFEKLLALRNDVGLLAEEYDPIRGRFTGDFPLALSHIALVNAGRMLASSHSAVKRSYDINPFAGRN